ncbi:MAG TPA: hypothetical protein VH186_07665 [Chloroflexia bacterium]|nr:hypothetical protein [Chloroflexia bacterium]
MKNQVFTVRPLTLIYALLGLVSIFCLLRLILRLVAADELSPVGRWLVNADSVFTAPFNALFKFGVIGQPPGSTFEPATLVACLSYLLLAFAIAFVAGVWGYVRGRTAKTTE